MRFYLDTEFDGDTLLSLGMTNDANEHLYLVEPYYERMVKDPWVKENILPIMEDVPNYVDIDYSIHYEWGEIISPYLYKYEQPQIIVDWPIDARIFCDLLLTGPGTAVDMGDVTNITILRHVDIYPTSLPGAVQHNAWWDAMAIKRFVEENGN